MKSIKGQIFILIGLVCCLGCQSNSSNKNSLDQTDILNVNNEKDIIEDPIEERANADSVLIHLAPPYDVIKGKTNLESASKEKQFILESIDLEKDYWLIDPFEDHDYIGTPCEDDENGNCIRHKHH